MAEFVRNPNPDTNTRIRPTETREALMQKILMCKLIGNFNPNHVAMDDIWLHMESKGLLNHNGNPNKDAYENVGLRFLTISTQVRVMIDTLDLLTQLALQDKFNASDLGLDLAIDSFIRAHNSSYTPNVSPEVDYVTPEAEAFFAPTNTQPYEVKIEAVQEVVTAPVEKPKRKKKVA